jgi:flagellin
MVSNSLSLTSLNSHQLINNINTNQDDLLETNQKIASGKNTSITYKDPTNNAKAHSLRSDVKAYSSLLTTMNDKSSMLSVASNAISEEEKKALDIENIIKESQNINLDYKDKEALHKDIQIIIKDFDNIANNTIYNNLSLLDGNLENSKIISNIQTYNHVNVNIPSFDTSKIIKARFETGDTIKQSKVVNIGFKLDNGDFFTLPETIISSSPNTGIGMIAKLINDNSSTLGLHASYNVETQSVNDMFVGTLKQLNINGVSIGTLKINDEEDYEILTDMINKKSSDTGVHASLDGKKLVLTSLDGRGISLKSTEGLNILNLPEGKDVNYGKLTIVNYNGGASSIQNSRDIGFHKIKSSTMALDYFARGDFTIENKQSMGINTENLSKNSKITLDNEIYTKNFLAIINHISDKLKNTKKEISLAQIQIQDNSNMAHLSQIGARQNAENIEDIDYSQEIFNKNKYENITKGASYAFTNSLDFNKKLYDILFDTLKVK